MRPPLDTPAARPPIIPPPMPRKPAPPEPRHDPKAPPDLDRILDDLSRKERIALRLALSGRPLDEALHRAGFRGPLCQVRLLGLPRFRDALQRTAPLIPDPAARRALLAPLLAQAAVAVAGDARASGATRLAAAREADALLRSAGSPGAPAIGAAGRQAPGERAPAAGPAPGPGVAGDEWSRRMADARARRRAAAARGPRPIPGPGIDAGVEAHGEAELAPTVGVAGDIGEAMP